MSSGNMHTAAADRVAAAPIRRYMHEIDGVRGIALTLVVLFHVFGNGRVSGGVDVFLVLSAFFLTRKLLGRFAQPPTLAHPQRRASFQFSDALPSSPVQSAPQVTNTLPWIGRHFLGVLTRLVPSAVIVLAAVLAAALWLGPVTHRLQTLREVLASALYYENWELIASQLSYGAAGPDASPLQHFWSLAVQGQFFLAWPLLALVLATVFRARGRVFSGLFMWLTITATAASFWWALVLVEADQPVAYFSSFTRFWELGAGALIAFIPATFAARQWVRETMIWLGLAMVIACGFMFDGAAEFPGVPALWPVGASLLVLFGATREVPDGPAARILSTAPIAYLTRIAYQLYLWHWPVLVFTLQLRGVATIDWADALLVLAISFSLAALTELLVSAVSKRSLRSWPWPAALAVPLLPLIALATITVAQIGVAEREREAQLEAAADLSPEHPGAIALTDPHLVDLLIDEQSTNGHTGPAYLPAADYASSDLASIYDKECIQSWRDEPGLEEVLVCDMDDYRSNGNDGPTVVLTGGSYAVQWYPALRQIAEEQGWHLLVIEKDGCRLTSDASLGTCSAWNEDAFDIITSYDPDLVFTLGTALSYEADVPEEISPDMLEQIRKFEPLGIDVIGVRGTPKFPFNVPDCMVEHRDDVTACSYPREAKLDPLFLETMTPLLPSNMSIIDMSDAICGEQTCEPVVGGVLVYRDGGHLTATYAGTTAIPLGRALKDAAPQLFQTPSE